MARIARVVVPNYPHHITQRGNRRQKTFFSKRDYQYYLRLALEAREKASVEVWAYWYDSRGNAERMARSIVSDVDV